MKLKRFKWGWFCAYAAAMVFAWVFVWFAGHRGVFLLDQSILFDGAWRVFQGQVPYRDFFSTFPLIPLLIQSVFFFLVGVDFSAMVLAAAVVNAVATLCVICLIRRLLPEQPLMAFIAGLLTAVWFQAPFGTLWFEQTAFLFGLVALVLLVEAVFVRDRVAPWLRIAAGGLLIGSMLSKQNAGVEFVPVALGVIAVTQFSDSRKCVLGLAQTCFGMLAASAIFVIWLWSFSSPSDFWHCYVVLTRQIGSDRIDLGTTLLGIFTLGATWPHSIISVAVLVCGFLKLRASAISVPNKALIAWIVVGCVFFQNLFKLHTDNETPNAFPFLGMVYALSLGFLLQVTRKQGLSDQPHGHGWRKTAPYVVMAAVVFTSALRDGLRNSWERTVHQFAVGTPFVGGVQVPGMSRVKWGEPTVLGTRTMISKQDFEELNRWIERDGSNFFVFPDSTMLYGLHRRISPQPWLYFSPGHSFLRGDLIDVDAVVVESLYRNNVRVIVLEKDSWVGNQDLWKEMPQLRSWIQADFEMLREFGPFEVWKLRMHD